MDEAPGCDTQVEPFLQWLKQRHIRVVVWDMDRTLSSMHCGSGLPRDQLASYVAAVSPHFVRAATAIARDKHFLGQAVATGSDPLEYELPGQSQETHILGPDLARHCLQAHVDHDVVDSFHIMVGYDARLDAHRGPDGSPPGATHAGKRHHMRLIGKHYNVQPEHMILFDDAPSSLQSDDAGWHGVLVKGKQGFRFEHVLHGTTEDV